MKVYSRVLGALALMAIAVTTNAAAQFSEKDYILYAGDFNGDGRTDILYIGKTSDKPNGIALADSSGAPQIGFQSWPATYLGIPWSTGQYIPVIGDFNGDGKADILMQSATAGPSYLLLANTDPTLGDIGQIIGINQGINQTDLGTQWSADQHKIIVGDFDGDGKDDVLLQATTKGGVNAIVLTDSTGKLFTRNGSAIGCSAAGPQQCWTDGEQGLNWSTQSAVLSVGKFNADSRADILYLPRPDIVMIDFDITFPVPVFKPNTFGIFLSQMSSPTVKVLGTANQLWSQSDLGAQWSPLNLTAFVADFNGDGYGDILLQSKTGSNLIVYGNSSGVVGTAVAPASNVAGWNSSSYTAIVGKFGNSNRATLYLQAKDGSGTNYYTSDISAGTVTATASNLTLIASVPTVVPTTIGAIPASSDVTQNGAASYSIPIQIPRGTAGLTPDLALSYNSSGGNGLVGVGWNLTGLGIIARCPKTLAQDGVVQGVQLTSNDEYCLNGNRLRRVSGTQGLANSQYRTELETYALVTVLSSTSTGPTTWQVKTKDGLIQEYGSNADSRIGVPGNTSVIRVWALSKVSDRALSATTGNYWTVTYINDDVGTGAYRPDYIDYTTSSLASPSAAPYRVKFYYEPRNSGEVVESYYGGGRINQTMRLLRIELQPSGGGNFIRKYTLAYPLSSQQSANAINQVSRLGSVTECSPTACMAPTTFSWSEMSLSQGMQAVDWNYHVTDLTDHGVGSYTYTWDEPGYIGTVTGYSVDINGDGIPDSIVIGKQMDPGPNGGEIPTTFDLYIGAADGQHWAPITFNAYPNVNTALGAYDLDEDGKDDFVFMGGWVHQKLDGTYVSDPLPQNYTPSFADYSPLVDIDGDGYQDGVWVDYTDTSHRTLRARFHKRDGTAGFENTSPMPVVWTAPSGTSLAPQLFGYFSNVIRPTNVIKAVDVNGDGRQDLLVQVNNGWQVLYSNGSAFTTGELIVTASLSSTNPGSYFAPVPLDLNGDGCTDFAYVKPVGNQYYWYLAKSTCGVVGSSLTVDIPTNINATNQFPFGVPNDTGSSSAADFDGDGNMDLMVGNVALRSTGTTLVYYTTLTGNGFAPASGKQFWSDRNGDGVLDYEQGGEGQMAFYTRGLGKRGNMLVSAVDGFGKNVTFEYATISDSSVYTRGSTAIGRTRDTQSTMQVVKSISQSDGVGGTYKASFTYAGAKRNVAGRGFLGFATREVTDNRTGFVTLESYNNALANDQIGTGWEFVGTLVSKTVYQYKNASGYGPKVQEMSQVWSSITPTGNSTGKYPFVSSSVTKQYELAGTNSPISTTTTAVAGTNGASGIDGYGTVYDVSTTTVEGISGFSSGSSATVRKYTPSANILNDTTNWCVARPQRVEETRSHTYDATDGAAITRVSTQVWDSTKCRVTHTTVAPGTSWQLDTDIAYDNFNNVNQTTVTGSGISTPIVTQANFGGNGHLQQTATNAKGHVTTFTWNVNLGFRTSVTDPNNQLTTWDPDDFGREKKMTRPDGTWTFKTYFNCTSSNSYCGDGLLRYVVRTEEHEAAPSNNLINYSDQFVDVIGRVKYVQSLGFGGPTGQTSQIVVTENMYDNRGNVVLKTNPYYAGTGSVSGVSMTYDNLNRLVRTEHAISDTDRTIVSENVVYEGLKTRSFDTNGIETSSTSNVLGTVARAVDQAGKITSYTYDSFGELLSATDPANNKTVIGYNIRGFKTSSSDPDMGAWSYTYDALGQMLTQTDAKSQITTFTYDVLGRTKTRVDHPGGAPNTTTWYWDVRPDGVQPLNNKGQLYSVTSPGGYSETYTYDDKARRSSVTTGAASSTFVMSYGYDANLGSLSSVTYPASTGTPLTVSYSYQNGFAKDVRDASTGSVIWQANAQDSRGHVTQEQYGNGQITNLGFDQTNGRLYTIQTGTNSATQNLSYAWDRVGNLSSRRDNNQGLTESFSYDAVYRVTSIQLNNGTPVTTSYDPAGIGNVINKSDVGAYDYSTAQAGCTYYSNSQPHAVRKVGTNVYCYDANGSMVSRSGATVTWSTYNYPLTINDASGNTSTFSYGSDRNRYRTISVDAGVTEDKLEIGGGAFEKVVSGTTIQYRHNIQINGKAVAIVTRNATTSAPTSLVSAKSLYLHEDHLGSLDVITDDTNAIVLRTSFDAWGKRRGSNWSGDPTAADKAAIASATRKGYTGHQQLDNLNLVHMNGRVYDPVIARFMSADPIIQDPYHSQSFNRYSYVWNNPLNLTDPTGFEKQSDDVGKHRVPEDPCTGSRVIPGSNPNCPSYDPSNYDRSNSKKGNGSATKSTNQQSTSQTGGNNSAQDTSTTKSEEPQKEKPISVSQKFRNFLEFGFKSQAEIDAWGAGLIVARNLGGDAGATEYMRQNPPFGGFIMLSEMIAGGGWVSTAGRTPLAPMLAGREVGAGFTGVFDSATGQMLLRPSVAVPKGTQPPAGFAAREGGHAAVSRTLGGNAANQAGFAVVIGKGGSLEISWLSRTLNKGPGNLVPEAMRTKIVEEVEKYTGRKVTFN